jgi:ATP-dependent Lon protease
MMSNNSALINSVINLPIANMHQVYDASEVERKLNKLRGSGQQSERESLCNVYERMLEAGPARFSIKPSGLPQMDGLYESLPNFGPVLDEIKRHLALSQDSSDGLEITPLLLLGPPGVGKTHFASQIASLLGTGINLVPMSSMTASWLLSGSSAQWRGSRPGKVFESLVDGQYANPVIVVDEIDKASADAQYDPLGALYGLLEHDTAKHFVDEFAEVPIDASQVIWIMTANDDRHIPSPILNRMNVYEIQAPDAQAARQIATRMYRSILAEHDWGERFDQDVSEDVLERMAQMPPREMRRAWMRGLGNAKLQGRYRVEIEDLPDATGTKSRLGFLS